MVQAVFSYAVKRVIRSPGLFAALLLGVVLASTFFAGINIGADTTARAALNQQLDSVPVDIVVSLYSSQSLTSATWATAASEVASVQYVDSAEVITRANWYGNTTFDFSSPSSLVGISNASRVYDGLTVASGATSLGVNETYVWAGSKDADKMILNSMLVLSFTYWSGDAEPPGERSMNLTLRVVGFVELDEKALSIVASWSGATISPYDSGLMFPGNQGNLLIVSWEKTIGRLLDSFASSVQRYNSPFTTSILATVDRGGLIIAWDIPSSLSSVRTVTEQVSQKVAGYGMSAYNNLELVLAQYQSTSMNMRFSFLVVALPVFFVAWYVGTTVSDVSYNLRRRETGLMLTKGFSTGQLFRMFLTESIIIGVVGGLAGVALGFLLSPIFGTAAGGGSWAATVLSPEVIVVAVIFGLTITLLSTFRPTRRTLKLSTVDALREYMYVEEVKPYRQRWPWVAFVLGTYKIVMFIFGIDVARLFIGHGMPFTNIFLVILLTIWMGIDFVLTYIGPLFFFWGFTKIFIRGSLKFQELVARVARPLGDLGTLATKNVRRNPARAASIAFLIALIVGYSFQTVGTVASEQDYIIRKVKADVGADISVQLASIGNASAIASAIGRIQGVASTCLVYSLSGSLPSQYSSRLQIRAVDPELWLSAAYYENEWFSGNDVSTAFQQMKVNNHTVILERSVAGSLGRKIGDNITLNLDSQLTELTIVGFFGPESAQQYVVDPYYQYNIVGNFWSYIPLGLYQTIASQVSASANVMVKLEPDASWKPITTEILDLSEVTSASSTAEQLESYQGDLTLTGSLNIQRVGVIFSILAASVATGLATSVSLQERKKEASIMSARGLSFKQLVTMFLTENLSILIFASFLGVVVGIIVAQGNIAASNATMSYSLVAHRMTFPPDAIMLLGVCLILTFASAIIPVILLTKRYISKMERIVRL
jgi:ABC-type antimicrobial peptide transport system permease subunit